MAGIAVADPLAEAQARWLFWALASLAVVASVVLAIAAGMAAGRESARRWAFWLASTVLFAGLHFVRESRDPARLLSREISSAGSVLRAVGIVDEEPVPGSPRFYVRLKSAVFGSHGDLEKSRLAAEGARVAVAWPAGMEPPAYGDRIEFTGTARNLSQPRNPGEFDAPAQRRRLGVFTEVRVRYPADAKVLAHGEGNPAVSFSLRLRQRMEEAMARDLEDAPAVVSVIRSMVLGTRADIGREVLDLFRYTGTIHLFSVSGIHTAMLAALAFAAFQMARFPRRLAALAVIPALWAYCFITGLTASSLRATIMATVMLGGVVLDRPALSWSTLGASALAILLVDPDQLYRIGFQLSFILVVVLLAGAGPLQAWFERFGRPDPFLPPSLWSRPQAAQAWAARHLSAALGVSTAAWIASIPLTWYYFNLWSPASIPANLVAVAFSWVILALGLGSALAGTVSTWLSVTLNNANWLFTKALMGALTLLASIPGSHLYVEKPTLTPGPTPLCEVEVLDLAGGGAIHVRASAEGDRRRDWMIDCGGEGAFRWSVLPYLRSRGVNVLDGLLCTHGDSKHLGGAMALLEEIRVGEVFDGPYRDRSSLRRRLHTALTERREGKAIVRRGDEIKLAPGISLHVVYPPTGLRLRTADDKALVLQLVVDPGAGKPPVRVLLASDAGYATERWLVENLSADELRSDLLVKGMHANDFSGTPEFLGAVRPRAIVTCSADYPAAQRVKEEWALRVESEGIALFRQEESGAVRLAIERDGSWHLQGFVTGSTGRRVFRSSSR